MAQYFKSMSTTGVAPARRFRLLDDEGVATVINEDTKAVWYQQSGKAGVSKHPTSSSAEMTSIVAVVKQNLTSGKYGFDGLSTTNGRVSVTKATTTSSNNANLHPSSNSGGNISTSNVIATNPNVGQVSFLQRLINWLFGL